MLNNAALQAYVKDNTISTLAGGPSPYAGFRNVLFNIVGPLAAGKLSDIIRMKALIDSSNVTTDTKRFYVQQLPTPIRGPLNYDVDIDAYLGLFTARIGVMTSLKETSTAEQQRLQKEEELKREASLAQLLENSKKRLVDDYSRFVDEIVTRAIFTS